MVDFVTERLNDKMIIACKHPSDLPERERDIGVKDGDGSASCCLLPYRIQGIFQCRRHIRCGEYGTGKDAGREYADGEKTFAHVLYDVIKRCV